VEANVGEDRNDGSGHGKSLTGICHEDTESTERRGSKSSEF
jgi:hypothetical protein